MSLRGVWGCYYAEIHLLSMEFPNPVQLLTKDAALTPFPGREQGGDISDLTDVNGLLVLRSCVCWLLAFILELSIYGMTHYKDVY